MKGEKGSAPLDEADEFKKNFSAFLEEHSYNLDDTYDADEFASYYRSLSEKTLALSTENEVAGSKMIKERVTILACANASGTDRIPLLMIGKFKNPRCFKNVAQYPVEYRGQKSAWMTSDIFLDWYQNIFLPHVTAHKPDGRFTVLLDNAPTHPKVDDINNVHQRCFIVYLPPNVTSLIQPMDQGPISATKCRYKTALLRELLSLETENQIDQLQFVKSWTLLRTMQVLNESWYILSQQTLVNAWNKLLNQSVPSPSKSNDGDNHLLELVNRVQGCIPSTSKDVQDWVTEDDHVPVFKILDVDELLKSSLGELMEDASFETSMDTEEANENDSINNQTEDEDSVLNSPFLKVVLDEAQQVLKWARSREDFSEQDKLSFVKLRDIVLDEVLGIK